MIKIKKALEKVVRYTLVVLLVLSFVGLVLISLINPESYFFGEKLSGEIATTYLLTGGITGIIIAFLLFKKKSGGEFLSVLYFVFFFIETLVTNLSLGYDFLISPLFTMGLTFSIVLL
ncbi:MAG: hypothetical protein OEZ25_01065, partial [Candidatus Bathyarchaeota archaeon]|nr:hypothetical protein [Candidatus Bathyarchaeota archaeon]